MNIYKSFLYNHSKVNNISINDGSLTLDYIYLLCDLLANWIHEYCFSAHVEAHIPMREYGKSRNKRRSKRRLAAKRFDKEIYHKRELIESGFSSIKRKFGSSVSSKKASTIKSDIYSRLVYHNIFQMLLLKLRTEPVC